MFTALSRISMYVRHGKNICVMKNFMLNCDILTFFLCYGIC